MIAKGNFMPDFHYQIKGQSLTENVYGSKWEWPPVFAGKVTAADKKAAKLLIEDEYGRKFPLRVLKSDLDNHAYLLHIEEMTPDKNHLHRQFEVMACRECRAEFRLIDKYNDHHCKSTNADFCSETCKETARARDQLEYRAEEQGRLPPVIYKVVQRSTGKVYIGQTLQAYTLRWWQHLRSQATTKLHVALRNTSATDWEFSVQEIIVVPEGCRDSVAYMNDRERYWIETLNTIEDGFNTLRPPGMAPQDELVSDPQETLLF
jgi:hypothetical protein